MDLDKTVIKTEMVEVEVEEGGDQGEQHDTSSREETKDRPYSERPHEAYPEDVVKGAMALLGWRDIFIGAEALLGAARAVNVRGGQMVSSDGGNSGPSLKDKRGQKEKKMDKSDSAQLFKCPSCPKVFKHQYEVKKHQVAHRDTRPFGCDNCDRTFKHKIQLSEHARSVHSDDPSYNCPVCQKRLGNKGSLSQHVRTHAQERAHKCPQCTKAFTTNSNMKKHLKFVHGGKYEFSCSICKKEFKHKTSLQDHMVTVHGQTEIGALACELCDKLFRTAGTWKTHMKGHNLPQKCNICHKGFPTPADLMRHQSCHLKDKPWPCYFCNKGFAREEYLLGHLRIHSSERPFMCGTCGKRFAHAKSVTSHSKQH